MAHKEIFICDLCEKVIELSRPFVVTISIAAGYGGVTPEQRKYATLSQATGKVVEEKREVCPDCAQDVHEKLRLGETSQRISETVFKELSLYKPIA